MSYTLFLIIVLMTALGYWAAQVYVKRSLRSLRKAEVMQQRVFQNLEGFIQSGPPIGAARIGFLLATMAGAGLIVRTVLLSHYLPNSWAAALFSGPGKPPSPQVERDMFDFDDLTPDQRKCFHDLVASVIVYDGFRNPLSGWVLRHMINARTQSYTERGQAELVTMSVVARRPHPNFA